MNKLSEEEFQDRIEAVARARNIFINSGITNNISRAFELYQDILATQERALTLRSASSGNRVRAAFDKYTRPTCPDCGTYGILFRSVHNVSDIKSQLICPNKDCDSVWSSEYSIPEWEIILRDHKMYDFNTMRKTSKTAPKPGKKVQSHLLSTACPRCMRQSLYAISPCCGAAEGLIECDSCDYTQQLNEAVPKVEIKNV